MLSKIIQMLELQDRFNSTLNQEWKTSKTPYYRASLVEIGETYEHLGYKWWKAAPTLDVGQVHIEIVDIWHFVMSQIVCINAVAPYSAEALGKRLATHLTSDVSNELDVERTKQALDQLALTVLCIQFETGFNKYEDERNLAVNFFTLLAASGLSIDRLFKMYVAKNSLNVFRQQNGYSRGTYIKNWNTALDGSYVEDNVVLERIINSEGSDSEPDLFNYTMVRLEHKYKNVLAFNDQTIGER